MDLTRIVIIGKLNSGVREENLYSIEKNFKIMNIIIIRVSFAADLSSTWQEASCCKLRLLGRS